MALGMYIKDLSPDQRLAIESLLGRRLADDEGLNIQPPRVLKEAPTGRTYKPQPVRRGIIPKPGGRRVRRISALALVSCHAASGYWRWMSQIARNLTAADEGILSRKRYLIHDRDPLFTDEFLNMLADTVVKSVRPAGQSFGLGRQTPSLIVVELKPSAAKLFL
jgi:hypothetical protein